ncbi:MAG: biopolymer transporter ExbD [Spirochaetota bacterium]
MRFRRRLSPRAIIDLVPMIDVVFQLVIFFMVSSTFILTPGIGLLLPKSTTAEPVVMGKLVVTVASRSLIFLNREQYDLVGLDKALSEMGEEKAQAIKTVVLEGDKDIPYSLMVEVLDVLRKNGFRGVNLKMKENMETGQK